MKRHLTFLGAILIMAGSMVQAQEVNSSAATYGSSSGEDVTVENGVDFTPEISLDARFGYKHQSSSKAAGFGGDGLLLNIDGKISRNFSYSFSHYLNSVNGEDSSVFDNTNWLTLSYEVGDFAFTAGKDGLLIGSYEYDAYDLDSYFDMNSMFYNNLNCWQWGVKAEWYPTDDTALAFQFANSPFAWSPFGDNLYSYSIGWSDSYTHYETIWSVNFFEYEKGKFMKCISLGNMFYFGDFSLNIDLISRGAKWSNLGEQDFTMLAAPAYEVGKFRLFGKIGWEGSSDDLPYDLCGEYLSVEDKMLENELNEGIMPMYLLGDDDYIFYGAGVEFFPLKDNKNVRLHAIWTSNNYTKRHLLNVGLTWKLDIMGAVKNIARKAR